jgi:hypothetical protein
VDLLRQGLHFRGVREFDRQNYGKAYEAFKSAGNYRDSLFQMAEIIRQTSQPVPEIVAHYWAAYDAGDKGALPWLCTLEEGITYESKIEHPRYKEIAADLAALRDPKNEDVARPDIARELSRLSFQIGQLTEGLRYLTAAVLLGDPKSRILLADILSTGPVSQTYSEVYTLMLDKNVFDFGGFPFQPELIPFSSSNSCIAGEELEMSDEMSNLLFWLFDQGDSELRTPRLLMRRLLQEMTTAESYDLFVEYHNQFKNSFGYKGGIWSDITYIFDVAANLLQVSKKPDLAIYEYLAEKYGVRDLFDELVNQILSSQPDAPYYLHFHNIKAFTYTANFSLESAKLEIPINFELPSIKSFTQCIDNLDFDLAEEIFTKLLIEAKSDRKEACEELANLLEFIDRARFEYDFLPKKIITLVYEEVGNAILSGNCEILRETLITFNPDSQRPYYFDELEFALTGLEGESNYESNKA